MVDKKLKQVVDEADLVLVTLSETVEFFDDSGTHRIAAGLKVFVNPSQHYMVWGDRLVTIFPWQYYVSMAC